MKLFLHDTKTKSKREFIPHDSDRVTIYVCGPTVYDRVHVGNAVPPVVFDVLVRVLRAKYSHVKYVSNITDIEDKIIQRAATLGASPLDISKEYGLVYREDLDALFVQPPDEECWATEHLQEMQEAIATLIERRFAYVEDEHVLFDVQAFDEYGKLSNRSLEDMIDGARVEIAPYKKDPKDFVLWKPSPDDMIGWESPWGRGRPGWHIECSAMIHKHLGKTIDIHGGGSDLVFPHHENERAQSMCLHREDNFVRYWMHNGLLQFEGEKMSKSLGNTRMLHSLLTRYPGETIRYAILSGHYRQSLMWTEALLDQSHRSLTTLYQALRKADTVVSENRSIDDFSTTRLEQFPAMIAEALCDDLNTPNALAAMHAIAREMNKSDDISRLALLRDQLFSGGWLLGLLNQSAEEWFQGAARIDEAGIERKIAERVEARRTRDFDRADQIRDELLAQGIVIEDTRAGTTWRLERGR